MSVAFKRKYIDIPADLAARLKIAAAERFESERAFVAAAIALYVEAHDKQKAKAPAKKSGPTIHDRKKKR